MGDNNILPKGGFFRGVLAGLTLTALIFIGLANTFPLTEATSPEPMKVSELSSAPAQLAPEVEESSTDVTATTNAPQPSQVVTEPEPVVVSNPDPIEDAAPVIVTIEPQTAAPVSVVPQVVDSPSNDIQIGSSVTASPTMSSPTAPEIEAPAAVRSLTSQESTDAPSVSSEISQASTENDTSTEAKVTEQAAEPTMVEVPPVATEKPETPIASTGGLELTGQTLIALSEPAQVDTPVDEGLATNTAFKDYSAAFTDDGALPLMSFVLLATTVEESEIISSFSTPITLAVSADNPAVKDIIANYRASGGEVVLLLPSEGDNALRKGGNASDVSAFLDAAFANSEGVIGVMDGPNGDFNQDTRMISATVTKLSETGHAIMTINGLGLNRTSILAKESGVPATDISQYIDIGNGTIAVVRLLDKMVLQIGSQKSVTIYTESNPNMLFALKFWLDSEKAKAVTIAPVSAAILRN